MDTKPYWYGIVERIRNFYSNDGGYESFEKYALENKAFFEELYNLYRTLDVEFSDIPVTSRGKPMLEAAFARVFDFTYKKLYGEELKIRDVVFEACFFTTLCMFIHHTKRIPGMHEKEFVYSNSLQSYNVKTHKDYIDYKDSYKKYLSGYNSFESEYTLFRKRKERILANRDVHIKRPQGSAMRLDMEHEWRLHFIVEDFSDDVKKTYKDIRVLYNGINKALNSPKDEGYHDRLTKAYKSFLTKLKKIKYEKYLELHKEFFEHICKDKSYYGMNIYRFEKLSRLYNITSEVNRLLKCKDKKEEKYLIKKFIALENIFLPKVYQSFIETGNLEAIVHLANMFSHLKNTIELFGRLVLDGLIERGYFGNIERGEWKTVMLSSINEMADKVFYDPEKVDYTITPESQEKFEKVLSTPIECKILLSLAPLKMWNEFKIHTSPVDEILNEYYGNMALGEN